MTLQKLIPTAPCLGRQQDIGRLSLLNVAFQSDMFLTPQHLNCNLKLYIYIIYIFVNTISAVNVASTLTIKIFYCNSIIFYMHALYTDTCDKNFAHSNNISVICKTTKECYIQILNDMEKWDIT